MNSETPDVDKTNENKDIPRLKSKWDRDHDCSDSSELSDSDSSSSVEGENIDKSGESKEPCKRYSGDEQVITDSESETKVNEN